MASAAPKKWAASACVSVVAGGPEPSTASEAPCADNGRRGAIAQGIAPACAARESENNKKQEKQQQIISEYLTFDPPPHLEDRETSGNKFIKEAKHGSVFQFVPAGKNATDLEKHSQILSNEIPSMEFSDLKHFRTAIQPRNKE